MVDMTAPYAGDYVRASELPPNVPIPVVIRFAGIEQVGQDQKPLGVLLLANAQTGQVWPRKLTLNKGNQEILVTAFGKDGAGWVNQAITVWHDPTVMYGGKAVGGVKVAVGHIAPPAMATMAIPLPGPVIQAQPVPGSGAPSALTMNMAGHEVPLPTGMPSAPPDPHKPVYAGPGSDLDDVIPL